MAREAIGSVHPERKKQRKYFDVSFFLDWCKQCGLCAAFCPKKIISTDARGYPLMTDADKCTGCRFCEIHCPDFAITVLDRVPRRRKTDE
jgi:2-oxoglutarate ferredoxin oxidoreductase subunit delta